VFLSTLTCSFHCPQCPCPLSFQVRFPSKSTFLPSQLSFQVHFPSKFTSLLCLLSFQVHFSSKSTFLPCLLSFQDHFPSMSTFLPRPLSFHVYFPSKSTFLFLCLSSESIDSKRGLNSFPSLSLWLQEKSFREISQFPSTPEGQDQGTFKTQKST
jgi:hypothetical protein